MNKVWIRTWQEIDLKDIESRMILAGELSSDCSHCREIGLDFSKIKSCSKCGTEFKYMSSRTASGTSVKFSIIKRIKTKRPDLIFVDYDDYKRLVSKSKAEDFLRG